MQCGKYKVIKEIHVYNCLHGQLKLGVGAVFEIMDNGKIGKSGNVVFCPEILKYSKNCYINV